MRIVAKYNLIIDSKKMDKKITEGTNNFILFHKELKYYILGSGRIFKTFNLNKLLLDNRYFQEAYNQDYKWYRKKFWTKDYNVHHFYIPITKSFLEYYLLNWNTDDYKGSIVLSNRDLNDNVESFYGFSLEVEVAGFRSRFDVSNAYPKTIYLKMPWKDEEMVKK